MTKKEIIEFFKEKVSEKGISPEDVEPPKGQEIEIKILEENGGEDQGTHYEMILNIKSENHNFNIMCYGHYDSFEGVDWTYGDVYEVKSYEKTVTAWRKV